VGCCGGKRKGAGQIRKEVNGRSESGRKGWQGATDSKMVTKNDKKKTKKGEGGGNKVHEENRTGRKEAIH